MNYLSVSLPLLAVPRITITSHPLNNPLNSTNKYPLTDTLVKLSDGKHREQRITGIFKAIQRSSKQFNRGTAGIQLITG